MELDLVVELEAEADEEEEEGADDDDTLWRVCVSASNAEPNPTSSP